MVSRHLQSCHHFPLILCVCLLASATWPCRRESLEQEFKDVHEFTGYRYDVNERRKLVHFANFMKVTLLLYSTKSKPPKAHILDLVTRVCETKSSKYVLGSGRTNFTARRVKLYERFTGTTPRERPPRLTEVCKDLLMDGDLLGADAAEDIICRMEEYQTMNSAPTPYQVTSYTMQHPLKPGKAGRMLCTRRVKS